MVDLALASLVVIGGYNVIVGIFQGNLAGEGLLALPQTLGYARMWLSLTASTVMVQFFQVVALALGGTLLSELPASNLFGVGATLATLLVCVALTGIAASFAWTEGGGYGSGPDICQSAPTTPDTGLPTPGTPGVPPSPSGTAFACVPASKVGAQVVALAKAMADALYVNPACGGHISYPDCYYTWYKAPGSMYPPGAPSFPQAVIEYGQQVCPGCSAWANGTYQCVSFVRGAYSQVYSMTLTANAFDLWATYAGQPGWQEIPSAAAPAGQRGLPMPGDVLIFKDISIGHAGIVMSVVRPSSTLDGAITFSNANSVNPYTTMPLLPDLTVDTPSWPGYTVWGYIRPAGAVSVLATPASGQSSP